jgi:hypothetical protein
MLVTNSVVISTATGPNATAAGTPPLTSLHTASQGNGDININDAVSWTASSNPTTLTLNAVRDVNLNNTISATNGNLVVCCGRDANVNAAITTVNGSVLLSAGHNVNLKAALTTTDGNITMCAANDIYIGAQITLTRGSSIPAQSLGLPLGLVLNAGYGGTGPGISGGTVVFDPLAPPAAVTGPDAPVTINYNPTSYTTPTDYLPNFTLTGGATLTQHMLVFASGGDKSFDGTTTTTLSSLKGSPAGVTLVAGAGSTADFDTSGVGTGKSIIFSGYSLGGANANDYALPISCCGPIVARTTGNITVALAGSSSQPNGPSSGIVSPLPGAAPFPGTAHLPATARRRPGIETPPGVIPEIVPRFVVPPSTMILPPLDAGPPLAVVPGPVVAPPVVVAPLPVEAPPAVAPPIETPPETFVPRKRPRKQDRN